MDLQDRSGMPVAAAQTETIKAQDAQQAGDVELFSLKGTISEIRCLAPKTPNPNASGNPLTVADVSHELHCWANLEHPPAPP
jgi:hypothetical protein